MTDTLLEVGPHLCALDSLRTARVVLARRLAEPDVAVLLGEALTEPGELLRTALGQVQRALLTGRPTDPGAIVRTHLLSQIDALWWRRTVPYLTDLDVLRAPDLVRLDEVGQLRFRYRCQPTGALGRLVRAAERRVAPRRRPSTAGLRFERVRPEMVAVLDQLAVDFAAAAPTGTPPLWVNSLARSIEHQRHLRELGYVATLPSAHCVGYAADIELAWFARFGADRALRQVLLERQAAGDLNVIDEGQVWHVCVSPDATDGLRAAFAAGRRG